MTETVNKFPLAGDNSYLKCIEDNLDLSTVLAEHLLKTKKKCKILKKQDIHDIFIKMN